MTIKRTIAGICGAVAALCVATGACAQTTDAPVNPDDEAPLETFAWSPFQVDDYNRGRNVSVLARDRPEYDASGIPVGGFIIFPKLVASTEFNSNALASDTGAQSDWTFRLDPSLLIQSNWNRHELEVGGDVQATQNARFSSNNELAWRFHADGRLDIHGNSYVAALVDVRKLYIERSDTDFPQNATGPTAYYSYGALLKGVYEYDRVRLTGTLAAYYLDYGVTPGLNGTPVDQNYRDNTFLTADGRAEYGFTPEVAGFAELSESAVQYRAPAGPFGPNPNANETDFLVGANFDIAHLARGEAAIGVLDRSYGPRQYKGNVGLAANGKVEYFPMDRLTLTASARRALVETIYGFGTKISPGYIDTGGRFEADYELKYNLILTGRIDQSVENYQEVDRNDVVGLYSIGGTYLINRNLGFNLSYRRYDRASSGADHYRSFGGNEVFLTLVLQR